MNPEINVPTVEDLKSWRKMTFELLRRSWVVWVLFGVIQLATSYMMIGVEGAPFVKTCMGVLVECVIGIMLFEIGVLIAWDSDQSFTVKQFFQRLKQSFATGSVFKAHWVYLFICQLLFGTLIFQNTEVVTLQKHIAEDNWFSIIWGLCGFMPSNIFSIWFITCGTITGVISYNLIVHYKAPAATLAVISSKVMAAARSNTKQFLWKPFGIILALSICPPLAFICIPYFLTWGYVAQREILLGGGNKKVEKKVRVSNLVPQGAGA